MMPQPPVPEPNPNATFNQNVIADLAEMKATLRAIEKHLESIAGSLKQIAQSSPGQRVP